MDGMLGRYENIIGREPARLSSLVRKCEEANIILMAEHEKLDMALFYDALILSYYETGETDKAYMYFRRLYPAIMSALSEHIDIACSFLMRYSDMLIEINDYGAAFAMFQESLGLIEKLRGVSFSSERAYLGDLTDRAIRRMAYIIYEAKRLGGEASEFDETLERLLVYLVPRSIIEERNGNYEIAPDELLLRREREYYQLFDILNRAKEKSVRNVFYRENAERFLELKGYLEKNHPKFRPLQPYSLAGWNEGSPFAFLEGKLKEGEVFYRHILTENILIHILVSKGSYSICSEKVDTDELQKMLDELEILISEDVSEQERRGINTYLFLFEHLTQLLFSPLINQMDRFDSLYYMPDYRLLHVTPNFMRVNAKWGAECFERIELVIDYNNIGCGKKGADHFPNQFFISDSTMGGQQEIRNTLEKEPSFTRLYQDQNGHLVISEPVR